MNEVTIMRVTEAHDKTFCMYIEGDEAPFSSVGCDQHGVFYVWESEHCCGRPQWVQYTPPPRARFFEMED